MAWQNIRPLALQDVLKVTDICAVRTSLQTFALCLLVLFADNRTFANSLDPDQARRNVGPDLRPIGLTL